MTVTPFRLGLITDFSPPAWWATDDRNHGGDWWTGDVFVDWAQRLEKASFDFMFFEDLQAIGGHTGGSIDGELKHAHNAPKLTPIPLIGKIADHTERIGLIATASTSFYPPYLLARMFATLEAMSGGRTGWNIVTSVNDYEAFNYGRDPLPKGPERYARAHEYLDLVRELWGSWQPDAVVRDEVSGVYTDPAKVRPINFEGEFFASRGPLMSFAGPQGGPVRVQAGASDAGRRFAAQHAEVIFSSSGGGPEVMKEFRDDIHLRMKEFGRDPREIKIFYDMDATIVRPGENAWPDWDGPDNRWEQIKTAWSFFYNGNLDALDPDQPFPQDWPDTGLSTVVNEAKEYGRQGLTVREILIKQYTSASSHGAHGTAEDVGEFLIDLMNEVGGDGIMLRGHRNATGEYIRRLTEELVPYLQSRGAVPTGYKGATFRDNLVG